MRKLLVYHFIFFQFSFAFTQNIQLIRSLTDSAEHVSNDSLRALLYSDLNYQWAEYDFDSAWYYAGKVLELGHQLDNPIIIGKGIRAQGLAYDYQNEFDSAIAYYQKAADHAIYHDDVIGLANAVFNLGVVHSFKGELEAAIEKYKEASRTYVEIDDTRMLGILYNNMGIIFRKTEKYALAKESYQKSLMYKEKRDDQNGILNTLTNISAACRFLNEYDSSVYYSNKALQLASELQNETAYLHELINLAIAHEALDNRNAALKYYEESAGLLKDDSPYDTKAQVLNALVLFYFEQDDLARSKKYLTRMGEVIDDKVKPDIAYEYNNLAANVYEKLGEPKRSLTHLKKAIKQKEQLWDNEVLTKTTELEQLYEKDKREAEIAQLNAETQLQAVSLSKKDQQRNGLIIFAVLLSVVAGLAIVMFRQKKKSLQEKEVLIQEIHHRVKNNLQVISSLLKLQAGNLEDEAAQKAVKEGESRVKAMALIHQRLYGTTDLKGVDAQDYFENLLSELFYSFGVNEELVDYQVNSSGIKLDIDTVIPLGLIVNELITNTLKYAFDQSKEGKITISLEEHNNQLVVSVADNGKGMDKSKLETSDSFGWKMIRSLSRKLEAEIDILSGAGTHVQLKLSQYKLVA
ncbi:Two-component sensor histidine kinase, contains HisKA and HATPase domains [Ekhidna lutea]|uniref:histidine kinase n=1 Tax=Ekhidna lutea TaxID=447679 RepID=A0A239M3K4_EKHLU|nr:histidine kinase dimerization/phosphoacceptor domain -containing protein [Ekhidna lutea]SNT36728.1 Two-component sensor histidine kinase, contains HisKA and HATPase domains [Ekhidna lutea]